MKTLMKIIGGLFFSGLVIIACTKNEQSEISNVEAVSQSATKSSSANIAEREFHIFYASWDEWGRTRKNCEGWGLCNAVSCWFCCTDDKGNIVSCKDNQRIPKSGIVTIDAETLEGELVIELDPSFEDQNNAITNALELFIDEDLQTEDFTILSGIYDFNPEIGNSGGYKVNVSGN